MKIKPLPIPKRRVKEMGHFLKEVEDPRDNRGKKYEKDYLLELLMVGMLYGATSIAGAAETIKVHYDEISAYMDLSPGVPSHDCFLDLLVKMDPDELERVLIRHCDHLLEKKKGRQLIYDGTAVRGARKARDGERQSPFILNSVESSSGLVASACLVDKKENEKVAMVRELPKADLKEAVVSADALNNTRQIMEEAVKGGGHFVFPIKDEHHELKRLVLEALASKMEDHLVGERNHKIHKAPKPRLSKDFDMAETFEKGHGRIEVRRLWLTNDVSGIDPKLYPRIKQIGVYESATVKYKKDKKQGKDIPVCEFSWCGIVTDLEDESAEDMLKRKRCNWGVESFHWKKDNYLLEDRQTTNQGNSLVNFAIVRRIVYNLLVALAEIAPETKEMSTPQKVQWLAVNFSYIFMLVFGHVSGWREKLLFYHRQQCKRIESDIERNKEEAPPPPLKIEAKKPI